MAHDYRLNVKGRFDANPKALDQSMACPINVAKFYGRMNQYRRRQDYGGPVVSCPVQKLRHAVHLVVITTPWELQYLDAKIIEPMCLSWQEDLPGFDRR